MGLRTASAVGRRAVVAAVLLSQLGTLLSCSSPPPDPLAHWKSVRDQQASTVVSWVAYGDSITEGQGASTRKNRWVDQALVRLRATNLTGGTGYLPGWFGVYGPDSTWTPYAARTGRVRDEAFGSLGLRTAALAEGATQTYALDGTSTDLYYATNGGVLEVAVDGGAPEMIDTAGGYGTANRHRITFAAAGPHRLTVSARTGTAYVEGVAALAGDETHGLRLFESAHSGYTSQQFVAAEDDLNPLMSAIAPDLVTIELGVNDYLDGSASPTQLADHLRAIVAGLRRDLSAKPPSIVLVVPYGIGLPAGNPTFSWTDYVNATTALGTELSVGVLDMSAMGTSAPGGLWSADALHPSDAGHQEMARLATAYLSAG